MPCSDPKEDDDSEEAQGKESWPPSGWNGAVCDQLWLKERRVQALRDDCRERFCWKLSQLDCIVIFALRSVQLRQESNTYRMIGKGMAVLNPHL